MIEWVVIGLSRWKKNSGGSKTQCEKIVFVSWKWVSGKKDCYRQTLCIIWMDSGLFPNVPKLEVSGNSWGKVCLFQIKHHTCLLKAISQSLLNPSIFFPGCLVELSKFLHLHEDYLKSILVVTPRSHYCNPPPNISKYKHDSEYIAFFWRFRRFFVWLFRGVSRLSWTMMSCWERSCF